MQKIYKKYLTVQNVIILVLVIAVIIQFAMLLMFIASQESFNADVALRFFELETSK